jgi:alpha-glucosidase
MEAAPGAGQWWRDAVVYQVYPRSFQDSDGDGIGDLRGIISRLDHLTWLGVDALWLSPIYPSPLADMGYDVADYTDVAPEYGTLADLDELIEGAHARGLRVLLDLVPSHTSIEHPWFREHPDWYVWADDGPPNNWLATFGGPAWSRDEATGRWYLHSFYPEQPDLNWRNPQVRQAFGDAIRFWTARGVDGFRVDAIDRVMKDEALRDDPPATDDEPFGLPLPGEFGTLAHIHSTDDADIPIALSAIREAAGDAFLVGEVYLPTARLHHYLDHFDLAFAFEFLHSPFDAGHLRNVLRAGTAAGRLAWVLSNHDFPRLATRLGPERAALAAVLLLTLPGAAFIYQGDELAMPDGPGASPPIDRAGRDAHRHPMQWEPEPLGGFTTGTPWLPLVDPTTRSVAGQREQPGSPLRLYRDLIALRRTIEGQLELIDATAGVLAFRRGRHVVALNLTGASQRFEPRGEELLSTRPAGKESAELAPFEARVIRQG